MYGSSLLGVSFSKLQLSELGHLRNIDKNFNWKPVGK